MPDCSIQVGDRKLQLFDQPRRNRDHPLTAIDLRTLPMSFAFYPHLDFFDGDRQVSDVEVPHAQAAQLGCSQPGENEEPGRRPEPLAGVLMMNRSRLTSGLSYGDC